MRPQILWNLLPFLVLSLGSIARADRAALHEQIDAAIDQAAAKAGVVAAPPADDAEFLRRVYLDLVGVIPSADETRAFLADKDPQKRTKRIDKLLADDRFPKRIAEALTVMLMERRLGPEKVETEQFEGYLRSAIAANKPFDRIVSEILCPDPKDETVRNAAVFWTKRLENYGQNPVDLPGLTRDVGRMFLGVDLKCAQCHNHLFIREYKQSDFQGLFAFVGHTYIRKDVSYPAVGEKLVDKKIEFASVFAGEKREIGPRIPGGEEVEIPSFAKGEEWAVAPPDKRKPIGGVPKFSPLKILSEQLPRAENTFFRRNAANRLWFLMMGRGVVHPMDMNHKDNPPSIPPLLDDLSDELVAMKFDLKSFIREIALSQAYQRSSRLADADAGKPVPPPGSFRIAALKRMSSEQLLLASLTAAGELESVLQRKDVPAAAPKKKADADADAEEEEKPKVSTGKPPTLKELRGKFVSAFAAPPGEAEVEFSPTVASALFVLNEPTILGWLEPREGNLVNRLAKVEDADKVAEDLYLGILTRVPTAEEKADIAAYLSKHGSDEKTRAAAIGELAWSLLASTEFAVNH
jgi:hypothetical protein